MKKNALRRLSLLLVLSFVFTMLFSGCSGQGGESESASSPASVPSGTLSSSLEYSSEESSTQTGTTASELYVRFGDSGSPFTLHLYDNDTAAAIAGHVGSADWRLPIYHYDDYENWEIMQYYDIPGRYEIPSNPESVTAEQAGSVYYSEPNRIVLFFGDAQLSGEYTLVGYFDVTDEFVSAVENNPVVPGWNNKMVLISAEN